MDLFPVSRHFSIELNYRHVRVVAALAVALAFVLTAVLPVSAGSHLQSNGQVYDAPFTPGPSFNVGEVVYPSAHDFDTGTGADTCMSLSVPPGDTFTLSLTWEPLLPGPPGAGDLDLYIYLDSACTESALLTSSFNSNVYTGELLEITPQVRNIGSATAVAGVRIGRRSGRGNPGLLELKVLTGTATFLEHGTDGPPLTGQEGAPQFEFSGPFIIPENSPSGTVVGTVTATDPQLDPLTFFELEPAEGQTSFQVDPVTGEITVEDPTELDRESTETLIYWIGVTDGASASLASIGINLSGVNDNEPIAIATDVGTMPDAPVDITLVGEDADVGPPDQLGFHVIDMPQNGLIGPPAVLGTDSATITYVPAQGFLGIDSFTFQVDDGVSVSPPATVTVFVSDQPFVPTPTPSGSPTPVPTGGGSSPGAGSGAPTAGPAPSNIVPPSAPRFLQAEPGDSSVTITWQRPLDDGGEAIGGYRIFNVNTAQPTLIQGDVTTGRVYGLSNGTAYLFQVRAFNSAGFGDGALVGPVTPLSGGPVVLDVQATVYPDDTVAVWWQPPEGDLLEPVAAYSVWIEGGALLDTVAPDEQLIVNVSDLESDEWHMFRVTATDAEGEVVASGVSEPVYLPPTLLSAFDPLPPQGIVIEFTGETLAALEESLQPLVGGDAVVPELPSVLTVDGGVARVFVQVDGLHRAVGLPDDFEIDSEELKITSIDGRLQEEIEIADGVWISGEVEIEVDPTGIMFVLALPELVFREEFAESDDISVLEIGYWPESLESDYSISAVLSDEPPVGAGAVSAGAVDVARGGIALAVPEQERVKFTVPTERLEELAPDGGPLSVVRVDGEGVSATTEGMCAPSDSFGMTECEAVIDGDGGTDAVYMLSGAAPPPTPLAAPSEPPTSTPVQGPKLVVVDPTSTPSPAVIPFPTLAPSPTPDPASSEPIVPESGGGTSVVTWLMAGLLGLVVVRGAFYAVGRIRG